MIGHNEYFKRIGASLTYIQNNLREEINIKDLCNVSFFSEFHFHRIFKSIVGESAYEHILRLRLEKAAKILRVNKQIKLSDLAVDCGFNSYENFSRQFKNKFKMAPKSFQQAEMPTNSRIYQDKDEDGFYFVFEKVRKIQAPDHTVRLKRIPSMKIAFVQSIFGKDGSELVAAYLRLMDWAMKNRYFNQRAVRFAQILDDIEVTPSRYFRYNFSISVPNNAKPEGDIQIADFSGAKYVVVHCIGDLQTVASGWDYLYKKWLPTNGYLPSDRPALEIFKKGPEEIGWDSFDIECCIPIEKIS